MLDFGSLLLTLLGWGGAVCSVSAYAMVTRRRIEPDSMLFQGLNLGGAAALCVSASVSAAWPSAVVNVIWIGIGIQAILAAKRHVIRARVAAEAHRQAELLRQARAQAKARGAALAAHPRRAARPRPTAGTRPSGVRRARPLVNATSDHRATLRAEVPLVLR